MMKRRIKIGLLLMAFMAFTACSNDEQDGNAVEMLRIASVEMDASISTEPITRAYCGFGNGATIGVSTQDADGNHRFYQDRNVPYTYDSSNNYYHWTSSRGIALIDYDAAVSAYHPYTEGIDPAAIPVTTAIDWKCVPWQTTMHPNPEYNGDPIRRGNMGSGSGTGVYLYMRRIASKIKLNLNTGNYSRHQSGQYIYITHMAMKGEAIGTSATLNSLTNELSDVAVGNLIQKAINVEKTQGLNTSAELGEMLFIPLRNAANKQLTFYATVDGIEFSVKYTYAGAFESNKYYTFNLKLSQNRMTVESVTIRDFIDDDKEQVILE